MDTKKNEGAEIQSFNTNVLEPNALVELSDAELEQVAGGGSGDQQDLIQFCLIRIGCGQKGVPTEPTT